ncbi:MAG: hypothetical protein UY99_C0017G0020 [Parcubacteria group bacterium GW2011_GWA1_59_11]|nr:MAG: hypothetical protein UY99_C0017G0020 [Parcubacteria group bacterium GW2011_GWA1_59_11]
MSRKLKILIGLGALIFAAALFFKGSSAGSEFLWQASGEGKWLLPLVAVSALLDSVNPCAFSILLLTIAFLMSLGRLRGNILKIGGFYIAGIFAVYMLIGLGLLQVLHLFDTPHFMAKVGAWLLILLGAINVANEFFPAFPVKLRIPQAAHTKIGEFMNRATLPAAFALGALVGLCEFPCTGGPYLMVLGLLHDQATFASGIGYLLFYNLIFILPLAVILFLASDRTLLDKVQAWRRSETARMRLWSGLAMVVLGALILAL